MADYKKIHLSTLLKYYKRADIQNALVQAARDKEVAVSYGGTGYGKRPDVLMYPKDVIESVKQGASSFHCSEELWNNPLLIQTGMKPEELNAVRRGWDLILDIDCPELEYSAIAGDLLVQALRHQGVQSISVKFSGNHGFHIGVPSEAFPDVVNGKPMNELFPDGPRKIAAYLQEMIRDVLGQRLAQKDSLSTIAKKIGKEPHELSTNGKFDPYKVLDIDTILIASRHLYRMPYSLNEKSGLSSVVIKPEDILTFKKADALPEKVIPDMTFLPRDNITPNEGKKLLVQAFDFKMPEQEQPVLTAKKEYEPITDAIPEQYFPPCIQAISQGLQDGKKRALFILTNFLSSCGWSHEQVEEYLMEWNKRNPEPLRDVLIQGHLRHQKLKKKAVLPPNCVNKAYMVDLGVCKPDGLCRANAEPRDDNFAPRIKNPANYAIVKQRAIARENEKPKRKKKEDVPTEKPEKPPQQPKEEAL